MLNTLGRKACPEDAVAEEGVYNDEDIPALKLDTTNARIILKNLLQVSNTEPAEEPMTSSKTKAQKGKEKHEHILLKCEKLWGCKTSSGNSTTIKEGPNRVQGLGEDCFCDAESANKKFIIMLFQYSKVWNVKFFFSLNNLWTLAKGLCL